MLIELILFIKRLLSKNKRNNKVAIKSKKKWIKEAVKHPGALHEALNVPEDKKIPAKKLAKAAKSKNPTIRKEVVVAKTLKKMHKK